MAEQSESEPTISVVIPTRDRKDSVTQLLERLTSIPERPDEIVVVDDGSVDGTPDHLDPSRHGVALVRSDGSGPATARNRGAEVATSEWLVFLDDDDDPHPEWMATFRELIATNPGASYVSVGFERSVSGVTSTIDLQETGPAFGTTPANFIAGTFAVRQRRFDESGGFLDGLRCLEFTDLALRLLGTTLDAGEIVHDGSLHPLTIHVRPPNQRISQSAEIIESAWVQVSARNRAAFRRDPRFAAAQCSTVAVSWLREGRAQRGRRWLRRALRTHLNVRDALRLFAAAIPPARRRVWGNGSNGGCSTP